MAQANVNHDLGHLGFNLGFGGLGITGLGFRGLGIEIFRHRGFGDLGGFTCSRKTLPRLRSCI